MPLGPRDARKNRKRCLPCSASHLKCNGASPCYSCTKRRWPCIFPKPEAEPIDLGHVQHFQPGENCLVAKPQASLINEEDRHIGTFFNVFVPRNKFAGGQSTWHRLLRRNLSTSISLSRAIIAVGALQNAKMSLSSKQHLARRAFEAYAESAEALRRSIVSVNAEQAPSLLSTSFLLGVFELTCDATGEGWVTHSVYGTSRLLESLGPAACRSGDLRTFFVETRVFEVCRAVLFNAKTVLSTPPWLDFNEQRLAESLDWQLQDAVLNLMTQCASLCSRTLSFVHSKSSDLVSGQDIIELQGFANEGCRLRVALQSLECPLSLWNTPAPVDEDRIIALAYFHAISIYLSGIYDYDAMWKAVDVVTPTLPPELIRHHVESILLVVAYALEKTSICGLLFLVPLRIAGARCWRKDQEDIIRGLLARIGLSFVVAGTMARDLDRLWVRKRS